mmetsp:Transcript_34663/g.36025  ORF Transcript_34663/g.36025 Transcript_34663/m.36025 type:complete len:91 (-) Transcript_34663:1973-2245(-)
MNSQESQLDITIKNANTTDIEGDEEVDNLATGVIYFILLILLVFMCLFVYNLVKCYLPVWLGRKKNNRYSAEGSSRPGHYNLEAIEDNTI